VKVCPLEAAASNQDRPRIYFNLAFRELKCCRQPSIAGFKLFLGKTLR